MCARGTGWTTVVGYSVPVFTTCGDASCLSSELYAALCVSIFTCVHVCMSVCLRAPPRHSGTLGARARVTVC